MSPKGQPFVCSCFSCIGSPHVNSPDVLPPSCPQRPYLTYCERVDKLLNSYRNGSREMRGSCLLKLERIQDFIKTWPPSVKPLVRMIEQYIDETIDDHYLKLKYPVYQ